MWLRIHIYRWLQGQPKLFCEESGPNSAQNILLTVGLGTKPLCGNLSRHKIIVWGPSSAQNHILDSAFVTKPFVRKTNHPWNSSIIWIPGQSPDVPGLSLSSSLQPGHASKKRNETAERRRCRWGQEVQDRTGLAGASCGIFGTSSHGSFRQMVDALTEIL